MTQLRRRSEDEAPIIQLSIDVISIELAIEVAERGLRAGVDWLEIGTPLVSWAGINALGPFMERFSDHTTFLDGKVMDGSGLYVYSAGELGIDFVSVCGVAPDATTRAAVTVARDRGVKIVGDLIGVAEPVQRAQQLVELGVDAIYVHYGWDEYQESSQADPTLELLPQVRAAVPVPVGAVTPDTEMAIKARKAGADILLIGHPYLGEEAESDLAEYVRQVKGPRSVTA